MIQIPISPQDVIAAIGDRVRTQIKHEGWEITSIEIRHTPKGHFDGAIVNLKPENSKP